MIGRLETEGGDGGSLPTERSKRWITVSESHKKKSQAYCTEAKVRSQFRSKLIQRKSSWRARKKKEIDSKR